MDRLANFSPSGKVKGIGGLRRKAKGKVVLLGFDIDRVAGVFMSVDKAFEELSKNPEVSEHNWWLSFRKADMVDKGSIFDRVLLTTKSI